MSPVDENGIKTIIEYGLNTLGQKVKYTKKIKVVETVTKVAKVVAARKARLANKKFGDAKDVADESNVTIIDYNETYMTRPGEEHDSTPAGLRDAMEGFGKKLMCVCEWTGAGFELSWARGLVFENGGAREGIPPRP